MVALNTKCYKTIYSVPNIWFYYELFRGKPGSCIQPKYRNPVFIVNILLIPIHLTTSAQLKWTIKG